MIDRQIHARNELIEELKDENRNLKIQIEGFKVALELANKALIEIAIQLGFDHFSDDEVAIAIESLLATKASNEVKIEQRDHRIISLQESLDRLQSLHDTQTACRDYASAKNNGLLDSRLNQILALEENLNRARADHLEQLRAIAQMLEPLIDKKVGWANDWAIGGLRLAIAVVQNNIIKLDPNLDE